MEKQFIPKIDFNLGSINFIFDKSNATHFLSKITDVEKGMKIEFELQKKNSIDRFLLSLIITDDNDFIFYKNAFVKIWISLDRVKYMRDQLSQFLLFDDFFSSEVGSFQRTNSEMLFSKKKTVDLYFIKEV